MPTKASSNKSASKPTGKMGRPPAEEKSPHTATLAVKLRPEIKQELERRALATRHQRGLSARYGVSDYARELLEAALKEPP